MIVTMARDHQAVEYESGWYVERPEEGKPLEFACFVAVKGPFKKKATADRWAQRLNGGGK